MRVDEKGGNMNYYVQRYITYIYLVCFKCLS
jgi:hypothetical protein